MAHNKYAKRISSFLHQHNPSYIIGIDEVALGSFAGSLYTCAYIAPTKVNLDVKDSKAYGSRKRLDATAKRLIERSDCRSILWRVPAERLNEVGLVAALNEAFETLVFLACTKVEDAVVIVDGIRAPQAPVPVLAVPKADALVPAVSAASVIAKHNQLIEADALHDLYPDYGFHSHHGYGTQEHRDAIEAHGLTPQHRTYVKFIKELLEHGETEEIQ